MPPKEIHKIQMMYAIYEDGTQEPIVIDEIKDLTLEEAVPILAEHNFVKVVRCKDCRFYQDNNGGYPNMNCRWIDDETPNADDFCSYGERMEDE